MPWAARLRKKFKGEQVLLIVSVILIALKKTGSGTLSVSLNITAAVELILRLGL